MSGKVLFPLEFGGCLGGRREYRLAECIDVLFEARGRYTHRDRRDRAAWIATPDGCRHPGDTGPVLLPVDGVRTRALAMRSAFRAPLTLTSRNDGWIR